MASVVAARISEASSAECEKDRRQKEIVADVYPHHQRLRLSRGHPRSVLAQRDRPGDLQTHRAALALPALNQAIEARQPPAGCVHYPDRGVQYLCHDYVALLNEHKFAISRSAKGNA